ncbi:hypothetical protein [Salinicoccus roseus]|uniref:hypothetical protein n=1 Tax=Salinicoccus roseus TaxID=45670 RepID=UPI00356AFD94
MKTSELLRKLTFDVYNMVTKSKLLELMRIRRENESSIINDTYVNERENRIKQHAIDTTIFYSKNPDFPILSKSNIQNHINDFISNEYRKENLYKITTSGSYGTPSVFFRDSQKKYNQIADVLYFGAQNGYFFGIKHAFIRGVKKSNLSLIIQNEIHLSPNKLNKDSMEYYYLKLRKVSYIVGFPSVILNFIDFCKYYNLKPLTNIKGITTTAEPLSTENQKVISDFFKCDVTSRYASEEVGIIANRFQGESFYRINHNSIKLNIYEIDEDLPQKEGEEGRIIITDLFSYAMPLINYDTGDLGIIETVEEKGKQIKVLKEITGRLVEQLFDQNDEKISPFAINVYLKDFKEIGQFQFIQEDKATYKLLTSNVLSYQIKSEVAHGLKEILGKDIKLSMYYTSEMLKLASGKRPYIVNNYKK